MKKEIKIEEKEKKLKDFVNAIYQNTQTAIQSIDELLKISESKSFIDELNREKILYVNLKNELLEVCLKISVKPEDNNFFEKARLWTSIKMTTITDKTVRHLAEMMLLGTVMGTTTCYKDLCDYKDVNDELYSVLTKLISLEEDNFNKLKKYLKEIKDE